MNTQQRIIALTTALLLLSGCANQPGGGSFIDRNKETVYGVGIGAAIGCGAGALLTGDTGQGCAKGLALGGLAGGGLGYMQQKNREEQEAQNYQQQQQYSQVDQRVGQQGQQLQTLQQAFLETLRSDQYFQSGTSTLTPQGVQHIAQIARVINQYPNQMVIVSGHTDNSGNAQYNQRLSESRAMAVARVLQQNGVDGNRIQYAGYGSQYPVADNQSSGGKSQNRRVEITLQ
ncbi:MAG: OmpA family protein [bacterium]|nr:OmpA family protein [bacterium]